MGSLILAVGYDPLADDARGFGIAWYARTAVGGTSAADQLNRAIDTNDLARVEELLAANPELRQVLIDEVPLQRVSHPGRIPLMELLVRYGADVNGLRWGWFPALF